MPLLVGQRQLLLNGLIVTFSFRLVVDVRLLFIEKYMAKLGSRHNKVPYLTQAVLLDG